VRPLEDVVLSGHIKSVFELSSENMKWELGDGVATANLKAWKKMTMQDNFIVVIGK